MENNGVLNLNGLLHFAQEFYNRLKGIFVAKEDGKDLMTLSEKEKLAGISEGANKTIVDSELSSTSANPVENKVVNSALSGKVDKVAGKQLSTEDFTTNEKNKLVGIASGAQVNTIEGVSVNGTAVTPNASKVVNISVPTAISQLTDDGSHRFVSDDEKATWNSALQNLSKTDGTYVKVTVGKTGTTGSVALNDSAITTALNGKQDTISDIGDIRNKANSAVQPATLNSYATTSYVDDKVSTSLASVYRYVDTVNTYADLPSTGNTTGDVYNVVEAYGDYPAGTNYAWTGTAWDALGGSFNISFASNSEITSNVINQITL